MAGGEAGGVIAVATSIPPVLLRQDAGHDVADYQALCIQSWIGNGFRVISVNDPQEIPDLAPLYPDVQFVATHRNASEWTGRKTPYIADLLLALKDAAEPVLGIINSDLLFEPSTAWARKLPAMRTKTMVVAHRCNANSLRHGALRRYYGVDCFFFDRSLASSVLGDCLPFAMGAPWWDYWMPLMALLNGYDIVVVDRPAILHLNHKPNYRQETWREFARIFSLSVIRKFEYLSAPPPGEIGQLIPHLHGIAAAIQQNDKVDPAYRPFVHAFVNAMRTKAVRWSEDCEAGARDLPPADFVAIFGRFDERVAAGEALARARMLSARGGWSAIGPDLVSALNQASDDPQIRQILEQVASHGVSPPQDRAHRILGRIKSLFMQRQHPGPPE